MAALAPPVGVVRIFEPSTIGYTFDQHCTGPPFDCVHLPVLGCLGEVSVDLVERVADGASTLTAGCGSALTSMGSSEVGWVGGWKRTRQRHRASPRPNQPRSSWGRPAIHCVWTLPTPRRGHPFLKRTAEGLSRRITTRVLSESRGVYGDANVRNGHVVPIG